MAKVESRLFWEILMTIFYISGLFMNENLLSYILYFINYNLSLVTCFIHFLIKKLRFKMEKKNLT